MTAASESDDVDHVTVDRGLCSAKLLDLVSTVRGVSGKSNNKLVLSKRRSMKGRPDKQHVC